MDFRGTEFLDRGDTLTLSQAASVSAKQEETYYTDSVSLTEGLRSHPTPRPQRSQRGTGGILERTLVTRLTPNPG